MYKNWFHNNFRSNLLKGVTARFIIRTTASQYIHNFFVFIKRNRIYSFVDNNRSYSWDSDFNSVVENSKFDLNILRKWFNIHSMK